MKKTCFMAAFTCFCWGTMAPVSKLLLSDFSNMEVLGYGSGIAAITLLIVMLYTGEWKKLSLYTAKDLLKLILLGILGYFCYSACYYRGLDILPAQTACILNYLWPIFTVLLSAFILHEKFSLSKIAALILSFGGVIVIMFQPQNPINSGKQFEGYGYCMLGALLYAAFNVLNKKQGKSQLINMFIYITTSAILALFCCVQKGFTIPTLSQLGGLLWLGIFVDAAGFFLWASALQQTKTAFIANMAYLTPAISLLLSAWILQEPVYFHSAIGLLLILSGFFLQLRTNLPAYKGTASGGP